MPQEYRYNLVVSGQRVTCNVTGDHLLKRTIDEANRAFPGNIFNINISSDGMEWTHQYLSITIKNGKYEMSCIGYSYYGVTSNIANTTKHIQIPGAGDVAILRKQYIRDSQNFLMQFKHKGEPAYRIEKIAKSGVDLRKEGGKLVISSQEGDDLTIECGILWDFLPGRVKVKGLSYYGIELGKEDLSQAIGDVIKYPDVDTY